MASLYAAMASANFPALNAALPACRYDKAVRTPGDHHGGQLLGWRERAGERERERARAS